MVNARLLGLCCAAVCCLTAAAEEDAWVMKRNEMVRLLEVRGISDPGVISAMKKVPRHAFIPEAYLDESTAYGDHPCPIGQGQTISQPYIVAYMTEKMALKPGEKVLEIGTGSGYQAAVLAAMGAEVYSVEIVPELAEHAREVFNRNEVHNVHVLTGDGYKGWPEHAPYDVVIVTCAPGEVPQALVDQLADGGRMILPVGAGFQQLIMLKKKDGKVSVREDLPVRFVPMVHGRD